MNSLKYSIVGSPKINIKALCSAVRDSLFVGRAIVYYSYHVILTRNFDTPNVDSCKMAVLKDFDQNPAEQLYFS